jgi:hypothetical protein
MNTKYKNRLTLIFNSLLAYDVPVEGQGEEEESGVTDAWLDDFFDDLGGTSDAPVENNDEVETPVIEQQPDPVVPAVVDEPAKIVEEVKPVEVVKPVETPEAVEQRTKQQVETYRSELQKAYAISDEDADAILTDPKTVLPRLMANMHLTMLQQVGQFVQSAMPDLVQNQVRTVSQVDSRMQTFAEKYPDLVTKENQSYATEALQVVKRLYPKASFEEMLDKVGPVAYSLMGKAAPVAAAPAAAPVSQAKPKPFLSQAKPSTAPKPAQNLDSTQEFLAGLTRY